MAAKRAAKLRITLKKNRSAASRQNDLTRAHQQEALSDRQQQADERVSRKGDVTRRRTIVGEQSGAGIVRAIDEAACRNGRVLRAIGSTQCLVQDTDQGTIVSCTVRKLLRSIASDARSAVVAGDRVRYLPVGPDQGVIERVEPRQGTLTRGHQYREHVLVANVTQVVIVASVLEPALKPPLIDRFLLSAAKGGVAAAICLNKADLVEPIDLQPLIALYSRLGYPTIPTSATTGAGLERLRQLLNDQQTVFAGQSGVGKSSLINAVQPNLGLRTGSVSDVTQKGRHTTRSAQLLPLASGGWVVDTPGIRQLAFWDVSPGEVEAYFREFRPFVPFCKFSNCLHLDEAGCAIRRAVEEGAIARMRYESYLRIISGDE